MKKITVFFSLLFSSLLSQAQVDVYGKTNAAGMSEKYSWYNKNYKEYKPRKKHTKKLEEALLEYDFLVFAGPWCPDTQDLVPKFFKTLAVAGYPEEKVPVYLLDRSKESPEKFEADYGIMAVPTFVVLKDGKEVGRIIESANRSMEEDLLNLVLPSANTP
jgi:thiol-disulfide isomerase/thioredoxin